MAKHRHRMVNKSEFDKPWSLYQFRNPKVKRVLIGCDACHPKRKEVPVRKTGQIFFLESEA